MMVVGVVMASVRVNPSPAFFPVLKAFLSVVQDASGLRLKTGMGQLQEPPRPSTVCPSLRTSLTDPTHA
jgi:hypothetical protein